MIKKQLRGSELHFAPEVMEFIPSSWMLIDMVLRGIVDGKYDFFHEKIAEPVDDDGVVLDGSYSDCIINNPGLRDVDNATDEDVINNPGLCDVDNATDEDAIHTRGLCDVDFSEAVCSLSRKACQQCSRTLPTKIYELRDPRAVTDALCRVAQDIIDNYRIAQPLIKDSEEKEAFNKILDDCELVIEILSYKPEDKDEGSLPENDPACGIQWEFFTHRHMRSWHRIVSGRCIEEMDYNTFSHVLNCTKDYSDRAITPTPFKGMAMYAFLLLLMTRRMTIFSKYYPDGEEQKEDRYWAEQFAGRVNWDEDSYYIIDDEWKEAYISDEIEDIVPQTVSAEEENLIRNLLKREVFTHIYSNNNLDAIVDSLPGDLSYAQLHSIHASSIEELTNIYNILTKETVFLYDNIEGISSRFIEKEEAEAVREYNQQDYELVRRNNEFIKRQFSHIENLNYKTVHRAFYYDSLFENVFYWKQKLIYSELLHKYLEHCIVQNEKLRVLISLYINDKPTNISKMPIFLRGKGEDMSKYYNSDGSLTATTTRAMLSRALVRNGHIPHKEEEWEEVFSKRYDKEFFTKPYDSSKSKDILSEITRALDWGAIERDDSKFKKNFTIKGEKLSWKRLQKAFTDGDITEERRFRAIQGLYKLTMKNDDADN